jgi:hypothetical protein
MSYRYALAALVVAVAGCDLEQGALLDPTTAEDVDLDRGEDDFDQEAPIDGGILVPDRVEVYVGEDLLLDIRLEDPGVGTLLPSQLPEGSEFEPLQDGGLFHWRPEPEDIGTHDVIFLVVDIDDPNLVIFQHSTIIDVLPRFDLIEYGF